MASTLDGGGGGGGVLDFLFQGSAPPSVTSYGSQTTGVPQWLSDYLQGTASRANAIAGEGFQPYGGPRIAGLDPAQSHAGDLTMNATGALGGPSAWQPGFGLAGNSYGAAGRHNAADAAAPWLNQASGTFPGAVDSYMSPYMSHVTDRAAMLGQRNLTENLLPAMGDTFTRAGQHGSTRHVEEMGRALRNTQEGITSQQLAALDQGYGRAGQLHGQDMSRLAGIGQTAGNMATLAADDWRALGTDWMNLGRGSQSASLTDAAALDAVGAQRRQFDQSNLDLAYNDFREQTDYPRNTIDWMSSVVRGMPSPGTSQSSSVTAPGSNFGPSGLSQIVGAMQFGNLFGGNRAEGGLVDGYAKGGSVIDAEYDAPPLATYARRHSPPALLRKATSYKKGGYVKPPRYAYGGRVPDDYEPRRAYLPPQRRKTGKPTYKKAG
jgi:hypothetical protein